MWTAFQTKKLFDTRDWIFYFKKAEWKYIICTEVLKELNMYYLVKIKQESSSLLKGLVSSGRCVFRLASGPQDWPLEECNQWLLWIIEINWFSVFEWKFFAR